MRLTRSMLEALGARSGDAGQYLRHLNRAMTEHGIDTPLRAAHFLAQVFHESTRLRRVSENLRYSTAERILAVFGSRIGRNEAHTFVRQPAKLANRVYANRIGNGDEASGDGWRYRGRGLIQLTGKSNYRRFARWSGEDAIANPDRVATDLAVLSAVFFWVTHDLNEAADADDVRRATKTINGGFNGLADRVALLDKAKSVLRFEANRELQTLEPSHQVAATSLNLRSAPRVSASTWLAKLAHGTPVARVGPGGAPGWARIRAVVAGSIVEGVVSERFLEPLGRGIEEPAPIRSPELPAPPEAHLARGRRDVTRAHDGHRSFPLGESGRPTRTATSPDTRAAQLVAIARWLDSEAPSHRRYRPRRGATYAAVYACDFCHLAKVYLPRVWWMGSALERIARGDTPDVQLERSVEELTGNRLHGWLLEYGPAYGWQRAQDLDVLQAAANAGEVCLITGQRRELDRPGHATVVLPEHDGIEAVRTATGQVRRPVESQAGSSNRRAGPPRSAWWRGSRYRAFGLWRHP